MLLHPRQPFDLAQTLRFVLRPPMLSNGRTFPPLLDHFEAGEYRRAVMLDGEVVLYGVTALCEQEGRGLWARILAGPKGEAAERAIATLLEEQFSLRLDLLPFYQIARRDPLLTRLVRHFRGMRIPQAPRIFEALISAILEQQVNVAFAHQVRSALVHAYGDSIDFEGVTYFAFPEPEALAIRSVSELRKLQVSGPKARYILNLSRAALDGSLNFNQLAKDSPSEAFQRLEAHKGVGPWTAQYVGLRALGHLDCLPAQDVGLQKAIQYFYGLRKQPSVQAVVRRARDWAGWRSYATFYIWLTFWENREWRERMRAQIVRSRKKPASMPLRTRTEGSKVSSA